MTGPDGLPRGYGQVAYEAYVRVVCLGRGLGWGALPTFQQEWWDEIAQAVIDYVGRVPR